MTCASERRIELMWVDVSAVLWRRSERCHDLWRFVLWRCFDRLDQWAGGDAVLLGVGSSVVVWWSPVLSARLLWISLLRRPRTWPRSLLLAVSLIVLVDWCSEFAAVGDAVRRMQICSSHLRGVAPAIVIVFQVPAGNGGSAHLWWLRPCVVLACSLN